MEKRLIGILGEKLVCKWYTDHKYKLIGVNYKTRFGEIDIIAKDKNTVIFCEVKTRQSDSFAQAKEYVIASKQNKIRLSAMIFIQNNPEYADYIMRFDVAEVYHPENKPEIVIIDNAF